MKIMKKTLSLFVLCTLLLCNLSFSGTILAFASMVPAKSGADVQEENWISDCSTVNGDGPFSYYIEEDTPFENGSTFIMRFFVKDSSQIQSMTHFAIGFTVNGEPVVEDGTVELSVTHQADVKEPRLEMIYTLLDETEKRASAYGICYEQGLFLSYASHDAAMSTKYLGYMKSIGAFTQEECQQFFNDYYNQKDAERLTNNSMHNNTIEDIANVQNSNISTMASSTQRTISGTVQWTDDDGNLHPCQHTRIDIYWYATLAPHECLGTVYTTSNGQFQFSTDKSIWGTIGAFYPTFYLKIYAAGRYATVKTSSGIEYLKDSGALLDSGNHLLSYNYTFTCGSDLGRAIQIAQATNIAGRYAFVMKGTEQPTIEDVTVVFPSSKTWTYYSNSTIQVPNFPAQTNGVNNYAAWDTLMHEYGHHVQHTMGIADNPGTRHYAGDNIIDEYYIDAEMAEEDSNYTSEYNIPKADAKKEGIRLAWAEGWATVFGIVAQSYHSNTLSNIATVGDAIYTNYQGDLLYLEKNHHSSRYAMGEGNEEGVGAVLYDMYDSNTAISGVPLNDGETFDNIYFTHTQMWRYVMESQAVTFSDFANHLYTKNYIDKIELGAILEKAGFSIFNLRISNNGQTLSSLVPPRFTWDGMGGSTYYPNNRYSFALYSNNTIVLQKMGLTSYPYTLTSAEWGTALRLGNGTFYGVITAEQTGAPHTGPYCAEKTEFVLPIIDIKKGETHDISINQGECVWLRLNIASDMRVSFLFSGSTNYEADMYSHMFYANEEPYTPLEYNTTSPSSSFRYTRPCTEGEIFYIRLYTVNGDAGNCSIRIY